METHGPVLCFKQETTFAANPQSGGEVFLRDPVARYSGLRPYYRRRLSTGATRVYLRSAQGRFVLTLDGDAHKDIPAGRSYTMEETPHP